MVWLLADLVNGSGVERGEGGVKVLRKMSKRMEIKGLRWLTPVAVSQRLG